MTDRRIVKTASDMPPQIELESAICELRRALDALEYLQPEWHEIADPEVMAAIARELEGATTSIYLDWPDWT